MALVPRAMLANDPRVPPLANGNLTCIIPGFQQCRSQANEVTATTPTTTTASKLRLKIATANVMTLAAFTKTNLTIARQTILMHQFDTEQHVIVGIHETQHNHLVDINNEYYHTYGHLTCRVPHSGRPRTEAYQFWTRITNILQKKGAGLPNFCEDANAHLGEHPTDAVGDLSPSVENQAGHLFHDWLLHLDMFLPATFSSLHPGDEHNTSVTPDGQQ